jgi:D-amino-acid dehydrogenase
MREVVIVGGGVIGLSTAHAAARKGFRVTVVERGPEQHDSCSLHNAGMVVPSHFVPLAAPGAVSLALKWMWNPESPLYIKPRLDWDLVTWGLRFMRCANAAHVARSAPLLRDLSLASRRLFEDMAGQPGADFGLVKKGLVMLCKTQHALDDEARTAERARELGIPAEVLDARKTAELDPAVTMDVLGSVYFPKDCHLVPARFLAHLEQQIRGHGGKFLWNTEVNGWDTEGGRITGIRTSKGTVRGDEYVLCGGSWSPTVARDLGLSLPMQAGKGYSLTVTQPRQLPAICSIFTEARIAVTPMAGTLRFGGTMEIAGLNEDINPVRVRGIIKAVPKYYPEFRSEDFQGISPWRGLRPVSPDGMPYLGRTRRHRNLVIATGHAMMGLSLAPITGLLTSEILSGEKPSIDIGLLDPDRFG